SAPRTATKPNVPAAITHPARVGIAVDLRPILPNRGLVEGSVMRRTLSARTAMTRDDVHDIPTGSVPWPPWRFHTRGLEENGLMFRRLCSPAEKPPTKV